MQQVLTVLFLTVKSFNLFFYNTKRCIFAIKAIKTNNSFINQLL
jgi:hypothetical protein